ncbi:MULTISPECIES: hypothetical protein [unclassified Virgibacillus]|uniref:hypothetical protein n=1 Tax=unclassified Virgibacillus TaxID=2620237 RepID=UPI00090B111D|nr:MULTISPECIES: hypothetical protein [unclassified Virgibacillus]API92688.1 hypothetical protein BKP57_13260 [Virgibacillus sp. 6R]MBS7428182.1 hypothetical protein [Virgibacillus sp. 19R1-5]
MKTVSKSFKKSVPLINPDKDHVFIFEDLEMAFTRRQYNDICKLWNKGYEIEDIAKNTHRDGQEILLALLDLARKGRLKRPFAFRRKTS